MRRLLWPWGQPCRGAPEGSAEGSAASMAASAGCALHSHHRLPAQGMTQLS